MSIRKPFLYQKLKSIVLFFSGFCSRVVLTILLPRFFLYFSCLISGAAFASYSMSFTGGTFYGPGKMPDVGMPNGHISVIELNENLLGETPFFNNGALKPNIGSSKNSDVWGSGVLSDGEQYNEYMDGGVVDVGNGALKLLSLVTRDGKKQGRQLYQLDKECNWEIKTDLAMDPGFEHGIIFAKDLVITTGIIWAPSSLQSQMKIPGGVDSAGSLPSGVPALGKVGDYDLDGKLDGTLVGAANIPVDHIFYPGAAVVQTRDFKTDIPLTSMDAAVFSILSAENYKYVFAKILKGKTQTPEQRKFYQDNMGIYLSDLRHRLLNSIRHLDRQKQKEDVSSLIVKISSMVKSLEKINQEEMRSVFESGQELKELLAQLGNISKTMKSSLSYQCS